MPLFDKDLERRVLAAMIKVKNAVWRMAVEREWFYSQTHRITFDAVRWVVGQGEFEHRELQDLVFKRIDHVCGFEGFGSTYDEGVKYFLIRIMTADTFVVTSWKVWEEQLHDLYVRRSTKALADELALVMTRPVGTEHDSVSELVADYVASVGEILTSATSTNNATDDANEWAERIGRMREGIADLRITTHIKPLDELVENDGIYGIPYGHYTVIAAKEKHGKTRLMLRIAFNLMAKENFAVDIYTGEMTRTEIVDLMGTIATGYTPTELGSPQGVGDWDQHVEKGKQTLSELDYRIFNGRCHVSKIENQTKARVAQIGERKLLVIVDYVQLFKGEGKNEWEQLRDVTKRLTDVAHVTPCWVLGAAQFNTSVGDAEPSHNALFGGKQINQDIDELFVFYRSALDSKNPTEELLRQGKLKLAVNRHGPPGKVAFLDCDMKRLRFSDPDESRAF